MLPENLRQRLLERVRLLHEAKLPSLERMLTALECGDTSPLWMLGELPRRTASPIQCRVVPPHSKERDAGPPPTSPSQSDEPSPQSTSTTATNDWPHAPVHRLDAGGGAFLVTAGTLYKQHYFRTAQRLELLHDNLLTLAKEYGWRLEAWAIFSNHYHFVGHVPKNADNLKVFLDHLHMATAQEVNHLDGIAGRKVWHNFWETKLTFERSYFARLNYVHQNAVRHRLVPVANQYRWCSAAWFERTATLAQVKTIYGFKIDKLKVLDDFDVQAPT